jgi:redox-sensitive bicupin YhaK (pirin superfamily)
VYVAAMSAGAELAHASGLGRGGYLYLIEGRLRLANERLSTGDAVKIYEEPELQLHADDASELLLVDVPLRFTPVGVWAR